MRLRQTKSTSECVYPPLHTGDTFIDLVCHDVVALHPDTPRFHLADETFFFCSPFCCRRFAIEPNEFVPGAGSKRDHHFSSGDDHAAA